MQNFKNIEIYTICINTKQDHLTIYNAVAWKICSSVMDLDRSDFIQIVIMKKSSFVWYGKLKFIAHWQEKYWKPTQC